MEDILTKNGVGNKLTTNWKEVILAHYDKCVKDENVIGLILRGSVAHNMSSRYSDLDLRIIVLGNKDEQEQTVFENDVPVHIIIYSLEYIRKQIDDDNLLIIDMMSNDVILLDKYEELKKLRNSLEDYKITEKVYFEYLDSAKSSMINAIDLCKRTDYDAACVNLRDASLKLGFLYLLCNGIFRPKQQWVVQQLKEHAEGKDFLDSFYKAQELGAQKRENIICQVQSVASLISYFEKEGLYSEKKEL